MTNIDKALEAHPGPWTFRESDYWVPDAYGSLVFRVDGAGTHTRDLVEFLFAAVDAYEPEQPCKACGGAQVIGPFPYAYRNCPTCNGTGKQPDARVLATENLIDAAEKLYDELYSRNAEGWVPEYHELWEALDAAIARAKDIVSGVYVKGGRVVCTGKQPDVRDELIAELVRACEATVEWFEYNATQQDALDFESDECGLTLNRDALAKAKEATQ